MPNIPRILVVEDDPVNLMVITKMLQHLGHEADVARDGLEAVRAAQTTSYDLIFMDVMMPHMDGAQATRLIRATGTGDPSIIAITANALSEDRVACFEAGMDDYVTKPIRLDTVRQLLATGTQEAQTRDVDRKILSELFDMLGGLEMFSEILDDFVRNSSELIQEFSDAGDRRDWVTARRAVHSLRSSSATFGGSSLESACKKAEERAAGGWDSTDLPAVVDELSHLRWRLCARLIAFRDERKPADA